MQIVHQSKYYSFFLSSLNLVLCYYLTFLFYETDLFLLLTI